MKGKPAPPTMQDVATAAGVHRTTVSLALRNHPRIPLRTRERIQRIAQQMGYQTHPLVSALMTYRANRKKPNWRGSLALLTTGDDPKTWLKSHAYHMIYTAATEQARELGYELVTFHADKNYMSAERLNEVLHTRNITAAIIPPLCNDSHVLEAMQWDGISVVTIGHSLRRPDFHRVVSDYFHSMTAAYDRCVRAGFKRIGLVLPLSADEKVDHLWLAAYLLKQRQHVSGTALEPLIYAESEATDMLVDWLYAQRPEVFLSLPSLQKQFPSFPTDVQVPSRIKWVNLGCYSREEGQVGIYPNYEKIGRTAVDFLTAMINRGERGIPEQSQTVQIKGIWVEKGDVCFKANPVSECRN